MVLQPVVHLVVFLVFFSIWDKPGGIYPSHLNPFIILIIWTFKTTSQNLKTLCMSQFYRYPIYDANNLHSMMECYYIMQHLKLACRAMS